MSHKSGHVLKSFLGFLLQVITYTGILSANILIGYTLYEALTDIAKNDVYTENYYTIPATLEDYWNSTAEWKVYQKLTLQNADQWQDEYDPNTNIYGYGAGSHIEIIDGVWYLFSREIGWGEGTDICKNHGLTDNFGIAVRKSEDKGITWTRPHTIITPTPDTPWECGVTDGDIIYAQEIDTWYYLAQCLGSDGIWNGCLFSKIGEIDLQQEFTPNPNNPVIFNGEIWRQICNTSEDDCVKIAQEQGGITKDEGTFDFIEYRYGYYTISFHGFDGKNGYRGIARTKDFENWITGETDEAMPKDSILDKYDIVNWREEWLNNSPVGVGAARTIYENGYYYTIAEAMDLDLRILDGQNWNWGIFRTDTLATTNYEQYPDQNPIFYSSQYPERDGKSIGGNLSYLGIFKDDKTGEYYLHTSRDTIDKQYSGIYIYKLVAKENLLENGDFWKCQLTSPWKTDSTTLDTAVIVARNPNKSSDTNCYLQILNQNQEFTLSQEIQVDKRNGNVIQFGGKFSTDNIADSYYGLIRLDEYDYDNVLLSTHEIEISGLDGYYKTYRTSLSLEPYTTKVTFTIVIYPNKQINIDQTFITQVTK